MFPAVKDSDNRQENKKRNRAIRNQVLQYGNIHRIEFKHRSSSFLLTFSTILIDKKATSEEVT